MVVSGYCLIALRLEEDGQIAYNETNKVMHK